MSGVHRGQPGSPVITAVKIARSWSLPAAVVVGVLATLGLIAYLLTIATNLERSSALLLVWVAGMVWAIVKPRAFLVWVAAGQLVLWTYELVDAIATARGWPASQKHEIAVIGDWLRLPEVAFPLIALVILVWYGDEGSRGLRHRGLRPPPSPAP